MSPNPLTSVSMRAARWSATHPWRAILGWLALVVVAVGLAATIPSHEADDADYRLGESGLADRWIHEAGLASPDSEQVLVTADSGALDQQEAETAAAELARSAGSLDGVTGVSAPQWNPDRTALLISIQLAKDHDDPDPLVAAVADVRDAHPDLDVQQAGDLTLDEAIDERVADDLSSAELISLPITLVLMLLAFGALIAAGLPVLLAATSVIATIGISAPLSYLFPAEPTVTSMIVLIGMAVGVDYSLFYLKREREERAKGRTTRDAVAIAAQTSGHSILVSGGAVIAAMAGLFVMTDVTFNSLATGSIVVVAVAVLGSITVLPALLAKLGRWVDRPRVPFAWRIARRLRERSGAQPGSNRLSRGLLRPVLRHPVVALLLGGAVVAALAVPALGMKTHASNLDTLPGDIAEVQTTKAIAAAFPSEGPVAEVVVRAPASEQENVADQLEELGRTAADTGMFREPTAPVEVSEDGRTSVIELAMPFSESSEKVDEALELLRDDLVPHTIDASGADVAVGGWAAESLDFQQKVSDRLPLIIGFVLVLTFLMMVSAFKSVPIAAISTLLNLASVAVAFGLMTVVFQHGVGESLLDFSSPGFVIDWIPLFVLVVLVGLSMDYHVFVVSRIREHVERGLPARLAVQRGVSETAGVITSAAAVMVSVFAIFATLSMLEMKMMGVGLSAALLLDATLVRLVILPAALVLLGERAWWPRRPRRPRGEQVVETDPGFVLAGH